MAMAPVSVIILTYNEEANIPSCIESVRDLTDDIFIVDSYSTDNTLEVARQYTDKIYQNTWVHFAHQRNWAMENLPISHEWVLFLDADERLTEELRHEIEGVISTSENYGFYIKRHFYFLKRWIKHGGNQSDYILRLIRKDHAHVTQKGAWEYFVVQGNLGYLKNPILHEDQKGLTFWIDKHNNYSSIEAKELHNYNLRNVNKRNKNEQPDKRSTHIERQTKIWLRENIWIRLPLFIRPFFYFMYRYIFKLGFLDGKEGFIYCFLHGLWYPLLVDAKYLEIKKENEGNA
jgi:glycosyltransferase involved in cell wall biosynthesis